MEIEFHGANCFSLSSKKARVVVDDNLDRLGLKSVTKAGDIALFTLETTPSKAEPKLVIEQPGEYEVSNVSVQGVAARSHMDEEKKTSATMYKVIIDDVRVGVIGHVYPELSDDQLEELGTIDVLFIPVGGNGYTLDPIGALKVIKKIEPKLVIPSHYADKGVKYEVPQQDLSEVVKGLSMEPKETVDKLKLKPSDLMTEGTQLVVLKRQ